MITTARVDRRENLGTERRLRPLIDSILPMDVSSRPAPGILDHPGFALLRFRMRHRLP
ncbi:MAG TPA: hypothetical protein VHE61_06650 [Opitutaceae bacterium]|nr:hypothetical protein [Opitutaceae bacterium]